MKGKAASMAGNDAGRTTAQLLQFVAAELQGAFSHIGRAMATYSETGALPPSMFEAPAATKTRKRRDKGHKRKPSAFNNYVKEKMAEIRASDNDDEDHATAIGGSHLHICCDCGRLIESSLAGSHFKRCLCI